MKNINSPESRFALERRTVESFEDIEIQFDILKYNFAENIENISLKIGISTLSNSFGETFLSEEIDLDKNNVTGHRGY